MHSVVGTRARFRPRPPAKEEATAVLHRSARPLLDRLPELADRVTALIEKHEPAYRAPAVDPVELRREVHQSLSYSVGSLIRPRELREDAHRCSRRIGAAGPARGLPLDAVLHAFRLGGGAVWQDLLEIASRQDPQNMRLLVHVAEDVWEFVDEHCTVVADAYRAAERELSWRRVNRLRLMTEALLQGRTRVADLPEVAAALGLPEQGRYAVAAVSGPGRTALRALADRSGPGTGRGPRPQHGPAPTSAVPLLWHPAPGGEGDEGTDFVIALLDGSGLDGDAGPEALARALRALHSRPGGHPAHPALPAPDPRVTPLRTGVSTPVEGLAAVGEARALAETALRSCPADGEITLLHDNLPSALVVSSPELASVLTERVLGPVLRLEHTDRALLLDTLTAWLECDESAQRAGERLSCHRNTVLNRLRRYEKLTGRSLSSPRETVELSLALTARRLLAAGG
ncbi:PucR family transcriptional regulator [Streptomyces daliensis]